MKLKIVDWLKKHLWHMGLLVLALIILAPILISALAPRVSSEVSADGLLGYIIQAVSAAGTIFLAHVAIRQNERFKEENDLAQQRLEELTKRSNELSIIGKVFDYERNKLAEIRQAGDALIHACDPETMNKEIFGYLGEHSIRTAKKIDAPLLAQRINNSFSGFCIALRCDPQYADGNNTLTASALYLSNKARKYLDTLLDVLERADQKDEDTENSKSSIREALEQAITLFNIQYWQMISEKTKRIDTIIYENKSLDEIKEMCSFFKEGEKPK